jgi:hypothetical protein
MAVCRKLINQGLVEDSGWWSNSFVGGKFGNAGNDALQASEKNSDHRGVGTKSETGGQE